MLTCARNVGKEIYLKNERRLRRIKSVDDETLAFMSESWSEREDHETARKRERPPVRKRPWIDSSSR